MKKYLFIFISLFFLVFDSVNAASCPSDKILVVQADAIKVTASYEFKQSSDGTPYFDITVSNMTPNIYITYSINNGGSPKTIIYSETNDGSYTFQDFNISDIHRYTFSVWSALDDCTYQGFKVQLVKPMKNKYFEMNECKYEKMKDYYYCKEWIEYEFFVSDEQAIQSIKDKAYEKSTTSKITSASEDDSTMSFTELYLKFRVYLIIGFAIGIVIDAYCLYLSFRKVRESTL